MTHQLLTDGGLETELIFNRGLDLPEFAAFPLVDTDEGRDTLRSYYAAYVRIAVRAQVPMLLETPTWRANPDHGAALGYDATALDRLNRRSVELMNEIANEHDDELVGWQVGGILGPRGDGYLAAGGVDPAEAASYHRPQLAAFAAAGADRATVLTLTDVGEGIGIARAAADVGLPVVIGFTVETDGRLPDGSPLAAAIEAVDATAAPSYFLINCAHPTHITHAVDDGAWQQRIGGLRVNASTMSHAELDVAEELDDGDPARLATDQLPLLTAFPNLEVLGGCCGTDARHVAEMWGVGERPRAVS
ncbi:homocysteine S-methyltransferase family protein [Nocardioides bizhenqiangii]|uniref:Homocysteine S-methyltransferase family protein n=1 Tax=Nocardioides bizhenqiangii TaxID=3095076 RepID=A0ABZ0ZLK8_9ACTN|nr:MULTISPECIES: homocysteine S-methyltransferase family protein [unclassified Nocardioides]MDZ5620780.1 homocysteine S-methyltransferase family protein [Nocardioides sp. HM23]WQQ25145.1 homocysteine S-methyltransferase family protein [Nocardioides sp. HM61]